MVSRDKRQTTNRFVGLLLVATLMLVLHGVCLASERFAVGITAGANLGRYEFHDPGFADPSVDWHYVVLGRFGVCSRFSFGAGTGFESGLIVDGRGIKAEGTSAPYGPYTEADKLYYLVVPATVGWVRPAGRIRPLVRAGAEFGYLVRARHTFTQDGVEHSGNDRASFPSTDTSILVGGGIVLGRRWEIAYSYEWGQTNLNISENGDVNHIYHRVASFAMSSWF